MAADVRGLRFRAVVLVTAVSAIALVIGGVILTTILRDQLTDNLDATLVAQATDRATLLAEGADPTALTDATLREATVWIGTADGTTLAQGGRIVTDGPPAGTTTALQTVTVTFQEDYGNGNVETETEGLRIAVVETVLPDGTAAAVSVGSETEVVDNPVRAVMWVMLAGVPALLVLVGTLTWVTADRALRPVEIIRSGAEAVGRTDHDGQVPVPDTGDEIERLAETVNDMLNRLARLNERQRQFVGDASHELKSPLANLRIDVETAHDDPNDARTRQLQEIDRLAAIVDDLLTLARHDEHHPLTVGPVDLDDVVFDALGSRDGSVHVDLDEIGPTRAEGDESQLRRVIVNLIDNAHRHAAGRIAISLSATDRTTTLHVDDDGPGIDPTHRDTVFERFARLDDARERNEGGTGLGLAIARQVATAHGGSLTVTDAPLGGARFVLRIPNVQG